MKVAIVAAALMLAFPTLAVAAAQSRLLGTSKENCTLTEHYDDVTNTVTNFDLFCPNGSANMSAVVVDNASNTIAHAMGVCANAIGCHVVKVPPSAISTAGDPTANLSAYGMSHNGP